MIFDRPVYGTDACPSCRGLTFHAATCTVDIQIEFSLWSHGFVLEGVFRLREHAEAYAGQLAQQLGVGTIIVEHEAGKVVRP